MQNPNQVTSGVKVPETMAELRSLALHRDELQNQLRQLEDQGQQLMQQRLNASSTNSTREVAQYTERINELTARITRIERQKLESDDAIAEAMRRGIATADQAPPAPGEPVMILPPPMFDGPRFPDAEDRAAMVGGTILGMVLVGYLAWRMAWRRAMKKMAANAGLGAARPDDMRELRTAVDAIAVEVERISENQRFVTALLNERSDRAALAEGRERA
jgi:polyhydroxyalkanoate synthesis regulator phasin